MKQYKVIAASCYSGMLKKVLNGGDVLPEDAFLPDEIDRLKNGGFIEEVAPLSVEHPVSFEPETKGKTKTK